MKSSQSSQNKIESTLIFDKKSQIACSQGKQAIMVCLNSNCITSGLICSNEQCQCQKSHTNCSKSHLKSLINILNKKMQLQKPFKQKILQYYDRSIETLSNLRDQFQEKMNNTYLFDGLSNSQILFMSCIKEQRYKDISGQIVWKIHQVMRLKQQQYKRSHQNKYMLIQNLLKKIEQQICSFSTKIQKAVRVQVHDILINSKIITKPSDFDILTGFFQKKIVSTQLLYRASENNYQAQKFHQKCDKRPHTITLCLTQHKKIIGGYTPLQWSKQSKCQNTYESDNKRESFIFSITNKDKFYIKDKQKAIYQHENDGPNFGSRQLYIPNKSHQQFSNTKNYKKADKHSYQKFTGSQQASFKIVQWEVYQVDF